MRKPDYENTKHGIHLYCGDCLEILPEMEAGSVDSIITDPVWPGNSVPDFIAHDPVDLCNRAMGAGDHLTRRIAIQLGCNSDPSAMFLAILLPFFRVCWLRYARPHYQGRLLYGADVAYLFGDPPVSRRGAHVIPGECCKTESKARITDHPCERAMEHAVFLVKWWSTLSKMVLDPFMGSGTTGVACVQLGRRFTGIEIKPKFFDIAVERIEEAIERKETDLFAEPAPPAPEQEQLF